MRHLYHVLLIFVVTGLTGCAGLVGDYETPKVTINSFKSIPGETQGPRFEIGLQIMNPNRSELVLQGMSYTLELGGHEVLSGVSNKLPTIAPYGQADVVVQAQVDLLGSIQFIAGLIKNKSEVFPYKLQTKLDPGGWRPNVYANRVGVINLSGSVDEK